MWNDLNKIGHNVVMIFKNRHTTLNLIKRVLLFESKYTPCLGEGRALINRAAVSPIQSQSIHRHIINTLDILGVYGWTFLNEDKGQECDKLAAK